MAHRRHTVFVTLGDRIGRGIVIESEIPRAVNDCSHRRARLRCDCGTVYTATISSLQTRTAGTANTRSCGCLVRDNGVRLGKAKQKHGLCDSQIYHTWNTMMRRCYTITNSKYHRYGGRGIVVCAQWHDVRVFASDIARLLGDRPNGYSLDRIENDGNYTPNNVRWASAKTQSANREYTTALAFLHWAKQNHPRLVEEFKQL